MACVGSALACLAALPLASETAFAHAAGRGFVMLLPTRLYLAGGAAAVAASFVLLVFVPGAALKRAGTWGRTLFALPQRGRTVVSLISLSLLIALLAAGLWGSRDPLANPLPLTVWTLWWVGLTLMQALCGNLWHWLNPWSGLVAILGRKGKMLRAYPSWLGYAPAIAAFAIFAWFELVDLAPDDPERLGLAVALYWLWTLAAMFVFGEDAWLDKGECFAVFFRFISRLSPFVRGTSVGLQVPGAALIATAPLGLSGSLFILLTLSSVSFDGLDGTFWWLARIAINPLDFPGRSAVVWPNSIGLLGMWAVLATAYIGAVWLGWRLAGRRVALSAGVGLFAFSIMPISLAYHLAHYLTVLLVNGQYAAAALSDPFGQGWDLFGLGQFHVTTSFLTYHASVALIWNLQAAAIVLGHVLAVFLAHLLAMRLYDDDRAAALSQVPLAALMVAYTLFGLWLLSTPAAA